jgi:hypothetical protein
LNVTPTGLNTLRRVPPQTWQVVSESSLNDCTMSNALPQFVHL